MKYIILSFVRVDVKTVVSETGFPLLRYCGRYSDLFNIQIHLEISHLYVLHCNIYKQTEHEPDITKMAKMHVGRPLLKSYPTTCV